MTLEPVLQLRGLSVELATREGRFHAVDDLSLTVQRGQTVALVGESGSGKSVTALSIMGLLGPPLVRITGGEVLFRRRNGRLQDLVTLDERQLRDIRGDEISIVFQEPLTSLNPLLTVGQQIAQTLRLHRPLSKRAAARRAVELLERVEISDAARRSGNYPHQLSGGMRQRVMIAMALACEPVLLLADEPTAALDVTVQAQILQLIRRLQEQLGMGVLFITHNLGVVAEIADHVAVMYGGQIVEASPVTALFNRPAHPYTRALLQGLLDPTSPQPLRRRLPVIAGQVVDPRRPPPGCRFEPRCTLAAADCRASVPQQQSAGESHLVRCPRWAL